MEIDFQKKLAEAVQMIEKKGIEYSKARSTSWYLQEMRKTVLANEIQKQDEELSASARENLARSSEDYLAHLMGTREAIKEELRLSAEKSRWEYQFEALRSLQSLEKAKMNMI